MKKVTIEIEYTKEGIKSKVRGKDVDGYNGLDINNDWSGMINAPEYDIKREVVEYIQSLGAELMYALGVDDKRWHE